MIASEGLPRKLPRVGEMVRVNGRNGLFMVTRVDKFKGTAHLKQRAFQSDLLERGVPFSLIQTLPQQESKAIQHFLGCRSLKTGVLPRVVPIRYAKQRPPETISVEDCSGM